MRGAGKPILFIAPAGGAGDVYQPVAKILSDEYKVITYDRRANARSTMNYPDRFEIRQQSRDALAVLKACGEETAIIAGNSSGAVIALDMAAAFPGAVRAAIIHEAPLPSVLPGEEAEKWRLFFKSCYDLAIKKGASRGATRFYFGVELPAIRLMAATLKVLKYERLEKPTCSVERISSKKGAEFLILNELLPITGYEPDFGALAANGTLIYIGCGKYGLNKNAWYARAAQIMVKRLSCGFVEFPGHHGEFMGNPAPWAMTVRETVHKIGW